MGWFGVTIEPDGTSENVAHDFVTGQAAACQLFVAQGLQELCAFQLAVGL